MKRALVFYLDGLDKTLLAAKPGDRFTVCGCPECGDWFMARRKRTYCTDACKKRAQRKRGTTT